VLFTVKVVCLMWYGALGIFGSWPAVTY